MRLPEHSPWFDVLWHSSPRPWDGLGPLSIPCNLDIWNEWWLYVFFKVWAGIRTKIGGMTRPQFIVMTEIPCQPAQGVPETWFLVCISSCSSPRALALTTCESTCTEGSGSVPRTWIGGDMEKLLGSNWWLWTGHPSQWAVLGCCRFH